MGLRFMGVLEHLRKQGVWRFEELESIHATSIGCMAAVVLCLQFEEWEDVENYFVNRPWNKVLALDGRQLLEALYRKGVFGEELTRCVLAPLLEAKGLSPDVTLAAFHDFCPAVTMTFITCEVNGFHAVPLSHVTHPDLPLTTAVAMSAALPGLFRPVMHGGGCHIDGGILCNFPAEYCVADHPGEEAAMLGVQWRESAEGAEDAAIVGADSDLVTYAVHLCASAIRHITERSRFSPSVLGRLVTCVHVGGNPFAASVMTKLVESKEERRAWMQGFAANDAATLTELSDDCLPS